jgi:lysozyme
MVAISDMPRGIDISNHQGYIDWKAVANSGIQFAAIKATESVDFVDPYFERNWKEAHNNGLVCWAYHFCRPEYNRDARREADFYVSNVTRLVGDLVEGDSLAGDIESPGNHNYGPWFLYWLEIMESYIGFKPPAYTAPTYINSLNLNLPKIGTYPLWLANWKQTFPTAPAPWDVISMWQYTDSGRVPGINGDVDLDRFNGTIEQMKMLGKPADIIVEPEKPQPHPYKDEIEAHLNGIHLNTLAIESNIEAIRKLLS